MAAYAALVSLMNNIQQIKSHTRLPIHFDQKQSETLLDKVYFLIEHLSTWKGGFFGRSLICPKALPLKNFGLLRVLKSSNKYSLGDTFKLVNLRFISIHAIYYKKIPSSLCLLWNLQILIYGIGERSIAPLEIWEINELRHLEFLFRYISLPDPPPANKQMNTMKNLQKIKGIINFRLSDEVVRRIPNIKTLKLYYDLTGKELEEMCLKSLSLLKNLESLNLEFEQQIGSYLQSNLTFPDSLNKLTLEGCGLHWEDMSTIASLPHLQVLILFTDAFIGHKWVLNEEEVFHSLKFLKIDYCNDLVEWIAEYADFRFPCLEQLYLSELTKLVEIPSGIGDIPTLQMIELNHCSKSVVISVKNIMEEQEVLGNVDLQVKVIYYANEVDDELESLASDNFLVETWW